MPGTPAWAWAGIWLRFRIFYLGRAAGTAVGRLVTYVVTRNGPEPVGETTGPPDYEHYVEHQLKPIADAILHLVGGTDFDTLSGARKQLALF